MAVRGLVLDRHVAALGKAGLRQTPAKPLDKFRLRSSRLDVEPADGWLRPLLRPDKERPPGRTKPRNELPPSHSITSSARPSSVMGNIRPSALAVLRLMTSSTFTACCTGRSAGF